MNASRRQLGFAWVGLTVALAVHVADEAMHDFLSVYNPAVLVIRQRLPWLPLPTFTFDVWLAGLIFAVLGLLTMASLAYRGQRWLVLASYPYAALMFANGLGHISYSLYTRTFMPGVWSSPLLLAGSVWLLVTACRLLRE